MSWTAVLIAAWLGLHLPAAAHSGASGTGETAATPAAKVALAPMSDEAIMGAACLGAAAVTVVAAYALGPAELLMLASGAHHVASSASVMLVPMLGIIGGGACALAAVATPSVRWLMGQADSIGARLGALAHWHREGGPVRGTSRPPSPVRPMSEVETQSAGCVLGGLSNFAAAMATSPMEVVMLTSGGSTSTVLITTTPLLGLGLLTTIVATGCVIGSLIAVPLEAVLDSSGLIGDGPGADDASPFSRRLSYRRPGDGRGPAGR
jgi:hypothetical protein